MRLRQDPGQLGAERGFRRRRANVRDSFAHRARYDRNLRNYYLEAVTGAPFQWSIGISKFASELSTLLRNLFEIRDEDRINVIFERAHQNALRA